MYLSKLEAFGLQQSRPGDRMGVVEDIKNTQDIWRVIKGGFVFDPEELRPN